MGEKKNDVKLKYALRNDELIYIGDLPKEERGLKCNCVCPCCRTPVQARLGVDRQAHFAHNNSDCNPIIAQQTVLHLLAKEIIEEIKEIKFPIYEISCEDVGLKTELSLKPIKCIDAKTVKLNSVILEKRIRQSFLISVPFDKHFL